MGTEHVREALKPFGADHRVMEFEVNTATVELAAAALGTQPCRIAKTLSFMAGEQPVFVVMAGDARVDNHKYKERFGAKAKMMTAEQLEGLTGLHFGGVCPFGIPDAVEIWLDESLKRFETVFPACGSANSAIELTPDRLADVAQNFAGWVDVCKAWREQ